jgi:hypothetical protein
VRDVKTAINSSLESSEDPGPGGGSIETNIKDSSECLRLPVNTFNTIIFTRRLLLTLINGIQAQFLQQLNRKSVSCKLLGSIAFSDKPVTYNVVTVTVNWTRRQLCTYPSSKKKPGTIGRSVVSQSNLHTITRQLMTVCSADNNIPLKSGIRNLKVKKGEFYDMKYCFSSPFAFSIKTTSRICPKLT